MQFERWADLRVDLGQAAELDLGPSLYEGDTNPLKVGVRLYDASGEVAVGGDPAARAVTASGQVIAPLATGKSGNTAWCIVPQGALQRGLLRVYLRAADSADTAVMLYAHGTVRDTGDGEPLSPGTPVPNLEEMQEAAAQAVAAAASAASAAAAAVGNFAPAFDQATANDAGSYVIYTDGKMYYLPNGHTAGTTWADTTKNEVTAGGELADIKGAITGVLTDRNVLIFYGLLKPNEIKTKIIAGKNYANGDYISAGQWLLKATTAITSGSWIVPGTNCTMVELGDVLNLLKS